MVWTRENLPIKQTGNIDVWLKIEKFLQILREGGGDFVDISLF